MAGVGPESSAVPSAVSSDAIDVARHDACRDCGAPAPGIYCPQCGQETTLALPTARQFLKDAAGRYVALDGRLWRTLAALVFRPGFLTRAYLAGRRRRYIRPARLFLVLSLLMFAVFRLAIDIPTIVATGSIEDEPAAQPSVEGKSDAGPSGGLVLPGVSVTVDDAGNLLVRGGGPIANELRHRLDRFNALSKRDKVEQMLFGMMRYGPYAVFALLPAFAFLLAVAYVGRAKRYPGRPRRYAEHLVFAAHNHAFYFSVATVAVVAPWKSLRDLLVVLTLVYSLWSMKAVYGGPWIGVLVRAWFIAIAYFVLFMLAVAGLAIIAVVLR